MSHESATTAPETSGQDTGTSSSPIGGSVNRDVPARTNRALAFEISSATRPDGRTAASPIRRLAWTPTSWVPSPGASPTQISHHRSRSVARRRSPVGPSTTRTTPAAGTWWESKAHFTTPTAD